MPETIEMATDEQIGKLTPHVYECKTMFYEITPAYLKQILARLDFERKRADEAEYNLQVSSGVIRDVAKSLRTDPAQRRREIWGMMKALASSGDFPINGKALLDEARDIRSFFTAAMDAEKGGGG